MTIEILENKISNLEASVEKISITLVSMEKRLQHIEAILQYQARKKFK
tara:strand:+ start:1609 stop:1752 length:144 start_codon:yes stop_codon:yes gene_type:complete